MNFTPIDNFKEYPGYILGDKTAEICKPLFNNFPINFFSYAIIRKNNTMTVLTSDKKWTHYFAQIDHSILISGKAIHSWSSNMSPKTVRKAAEFGHYNGVVIEKAYADHIESLEFASSNPFFNPIEFCYDKTLLNRFALYFKDKAKDIIKIAERSPILIPKKKIPPLEVQNQFSTELYNSISSKKIRLNFKGRKVVFSPREYEILFLLTKGKSMCEISKILQISPRTVETYLNNAKNKTDAPSTNALLDCFSDSLF